MARKLRIYCFWIGALSIITFLVVQKTFRGQYENIQSVSRLGRHLFSLPNDQENCVTSKGAIEEFPKDFFTQEQRLQGGIVVHLLIALYTFALLAVVCDDYFVISLYHICARLDLDNDVAGATFMAIGSSAPTLFISVISIFFTEAGGDVGLGTVVGSTIFNTLFIVAICSLASGGIVRLSWYPLLRDSFVYTLGTIALVVTIRDRQVYWYEAIVFVIVYLLYIVIMYFNKTLERFFVGIQMKYFGECRDEFQDESLDPLIAKQPKDLRTRDESAEVLMLGKMQAATTGIHKEPIGTTPLQIIQNRSTNDLAEHLAAANIGTQTTFQEQKYIEQDTSSTKKADLSQFEHKQASPCHIPDGVFAKIAWVLGMPVCLLFYITIPPCCKTRWSEWFLVTFLMSVLWMGTLSYVLVWMVCIVGFTFNIPDCVMGMTFLAAGSSIPDVMASVIVARQGEGDMALSNAIGSNVFDMLCLGIPWLMKTTVINPGTSMEIHSHSIMVSALLLIGSIVFTVLAIHLNNWKLDPKLGIIFLIVYFVFISLATLVEFIACPCQLEV